MKKIQTLELLKEIIGPMEWKNEEVDKQIEKLCSQFQFIAKYLQAKDDVTFETINLFEEFDNPFSTKNLLTIETIIEIENGLKEMPKEVDRDVIVYQKAQSLSTFFNNLHSKTQFYKLIYEEKLNRYKAVISYIHDKTVEAKLSEFKKEHKEVSDEIINCVDDIFAEKDQKILEIKKEFEKKIKTKNEELLKQNDISSIERKKIIGQIEDEMFDIIKDIQYRYKEKANIKKDSTYQKRDIIKGLITKTYAETLVVSSDSAGSKIYNELVRKSSIIGGVYRYFLNREEEIKSYIITCNFMMKNLNE